MKALILFALVSILAVACTSNTEVKKEAAASTAVVANKTIQLAVEGMTCTGCENTIKEAVTAVPGVSEVTASHTEGLAVVKYDSTKATMAAISDAITNAGYTVKGEKAPAAEAPVKN